MKIKRLYLAAVALLLCIFSFSLIFADVGEKSTSASARESAIKATFVKNEKTEEATSSTNSVPDWLKRTSYGIYIETHQKPRIYLETVQPLYQSLDKVDTFFTHDRISIQDERGTYALGYGYRRLMFDDNLLAGINNFFDFQDLHKHYRTGVGLEIISKILELRANSYFRLSPKRTVAETTNSTTYERVANGGDVELGAPLPYLPWVKVFGSYYRYDFRKFKDMQGWKMRGEIKPFKFITINLETYDDNKGDREYRMDTRFNFVFDDLTFKSIFSAFKLNKEAYPDVDLKKRTLDRVERNFNIQVEKWVETGGMALEIGRK